MYICSFCVCMYRNVVAEHVSNHLYHRSMYVNNQRMDADIPRLVSFLPLYTYPYIHAYSKFGFWQDFMTTITDVTYIYIYIYIHTYIHTCILLCY